MPELPEVETIRRGLARYVIGKKITDVEVRKKKIVRDSVKMLIAILTGQQFTKIERRGKLLIFHMSVPDKFLLIHLKMTGQLIYEKGKTFIAGGHSFPSVQDEDLPNKYSYVIFSFADGGRLFFNDMRQFGYVHLVDGKHLQKVLAAYGPEPLLKLTSETFSHVLGKRHITIKAALLNQQIIAGIGNIYADESCFYAGVRPTRKVSSLKSKEKEALLIAIKEVLKKALKYGGTTFRHYRDAKGTKGNFTRLLQVYGRGGAQCLRCGFSPLKKEVVAGRGTVWCPNCQH